MWHFMHLINVNADVNVHLWLPHTQHYVLSFTTISQISIPISQLRGLWVYSFTAGQQVRNTIQQGFLERALTSVSM